MRERERKRRERECEQERETDQESIGRRELDQNFAVVVIIGTKQALAVHVCEYLLEYICMRMHI